MICYYQPQWQGVQGCQQYVQETPKQDIQSRVGNEDSDDKSQEQIRDGTEQPGLDGSLMENSEELPTVAEFDEVMKR
jgi:hypothetical protein